MSKKILMALMGLEIGGAETHVVELSRTLQRRGWEVCVVSNGGVYERELTEEGIRCYHAPLHRRDPFAMLHSLHLLRGIIRREQPDIVHAHARIPAFLCGILHRQMHFPFVTSAHWVFYVNPILRRLTNWGERTVAVSDDIKAYLEENYGVAGEQVTVTINGIDTEKFSPAVSGERVRSEFKISADCPTVSYVSRMDESRALVARHLVQIAPKLREAIPGIRLLIAGGGDVFDEVNAAAEKVNADAGERFVVMTGARTDINEIVAAGDLFVGVSRAALEAMAAEKAVIVAGNEGYLGLFDEEKLTLAQGSNFCCRGCDAPTPERLYDDIVRAMTQSDCAALGRYGRSVVMNCYSVDRMAADCEKAYGEALAIHTRVLVSGYYGCRNLGDDALLLALRDQITAHFPGATVVALSRRPKETQEKCGIEAVFRFDPFAVQREMKRASCLVSGGGSLLQDRTSTRSLCYYALVIRLAHRMGKKVMFFANGIGPVDSAKNRERVCAAAEAADVITLRDAASLELLRSVGVKNEAVTVTADPIYAMRGGDDGKERLQAQGIPTDRAIVGVSVRSAKGVDVPYDALAAFCDAIAGRATVVFLVMQQPDDVRAAEEVRRRMKQTAYFYQSPYDPQGMMAAIRRMDAVVSTRLHSVIFAACERVPVCGIVYDPKVEACLAELGMPSAGTLSEFNAEQAMAVLSDLLDRSEEYRQTLDARVGALAERAAQNEERLAALLQG